MKINIESEEFNKTLEGEYFIGANGDCSIIAGDFSPHDLQEAAANLVATVYRALQVTMGNDPNNQKEMFSCLATIMYDAYSIITKQVAIAHANVEYEKDGQKYEVDMPAILQQVLEGKLKKLFKELDEEEEDEDADE